MMDITYLKFGFVLTLVVLLLSSCEDVIQVETDPAPALIVVDGWLTTEQADQTIKLSRSQPYFDASLPSSLSGASVTVESSSGEIFDFVEQNPGEYTWSAGLDSLGPVGTSFTMSISISGTNLTATSTANRVPVIDSIGQEFEEESLGEPAGIRTNFYARDPSGFGDTYWIKTFKNDQYLGKPEELNIAYDAGFDAGGQVDGLIYIPPIRSLTNPVGEDDDDETPPWKTDDRIKVEIHSISNDAFFFLETARDQITNGDNGLFSIPLANTKGNVVDQSTGETILGVFNVAIVSKIEDVIK